MFNTKKLLMITATTIGAGLTASAIYLFYKNKKNKKADCKSVVEMSNITNDDSGIDSSYEGNTESIDSVYFDTEDENNIGRNMYEHERSQFINYLLTNGLTDAEINRIIETIIIIEDELPEEFETVRSKMLEILDSDFELEKVMHFDESNYNMLYSSIDPCQLFITNGFKILSMGPEYQDDMMNLSSALADLRETNKTEVAEVMYGIYHTFKDMDSETVTPDIYTSKFKNYIDKYVNSSVNTDTEEV